MSILLRTALVRTSPVWCHIGILSSRAPELGTTFARRALIHTGQPNNNSLTHKRINEESTTGTEGFHRGEANTLTDICLYSCNSFTEDVSASKQGLSTPDAVSTLPTIVRGDWVLFHPVYSPEELKAVEVLLATFQVASLCIECQFVRCSKRKLKHYQTRSHSIWSGSQGEEAPPLRI